MMRSVTKLLFIGAHTSRAFSSSTPVLGYNNCNLQCCSETMPSSSFMRTTGSLLVELGLAKAGYVHLNMDDCWMLPDRGPNGEQVADPSKFPEGIADLVNFTHSLGLKFGLYTALAPRTCGGKSASCRHDQVDASHYAAWGVDYLKEDGCGSCSGNVLADLHSMREALDATGRDIFLSVEGNPPIEVISARPDLYGSIRRVGKDIMGEWYSMCSLVDTGSGLWPFAHNDTDGHGGFFNDLDMLEVGNEGHFLDDRDRIMSHITMWIMMKAPMLIGTNLSTLSQDTIKTLTNAEALSIHQDAWGQQARRVASDPPTQSASLAAPFDAIAVLARCNSSRPTQRWNLDPPTPQNKGGFLWTQDERGVRWCMGPSSIPWGRPSSVLPCDDPKYDYNASQDCNPTHVCVQRANWTMTEMKASLCPSPQLGGLAEEGSMLVFECEPGSVITAIDFADWGLPEFSSDTGSCNFTSNAQCTDPITARRVAESLCVGRAKCVLEATGDAIGSDPCSGTHKRLAVRASGCQSADPHIQPRIVSFNSPTGGGTLSWDNTQYASGPLPHTRYLGGGMSIFVLENLTDSSNFRIRSVFGSLWDDDHVGGVQAANASEFCVDATRGGNREVWVAALSGWRFAVALWNRGPVAEPITVEWHHLDRKPTDMFRVRDVWTGEDKGTHSASYSCVVPAHGVSLLLLS